MPIVGVLAFQGDVREHRKAVESAGETATEVRTAPDLASVDALIIPRGESTTIGKLASRFGLLDPLRNRIGEGMPTYGTCAGMIFFAAAPTGRDHPLLGA